MIDTTGKSKAFRAWAEQEDAYRTYEGNIARTRMLDVFRAERDNLPDQEVTAFLTLAGIV